ncbi:YggT family protein [Vagococcus intermedius]|uniref:YggT family protein n=1 Tax=Vagococcus intermedius TaxID=2991418 RepID=A0AAF0CVY0_9ENTE|nr:YggT family protein [Vagococcus intermedius]WEG73864.1 YggT family protein [Vagococcus intermedius]WEG75949.1 YggT family protein [Vagococcus intermedius]
MLYTLVNFIAFLSELYSGALVIYALLSWFPGAYDSAIGRFLASICEPYIRIFDRLNLNIGGIGFSIMIAVIVLNFGTRILINFLMLFV